MVARLALDEVVMVRVHVPELEESAGAGSSSFAGVSVRITCEHTFDEMRIGIDASSDFCTAGLRKLESRRSWGLRGIQSIVLPRAWVFRRVDEGATPTTGRQSGLSTRPVTVQR